jgi:hypothetical protein
MSFASIAIKTSIPGTAPAATSGALTFSSIDPVNWLQITGEASAGSGSLYLLRWNADLEEWRPYQEDKPIAVDSSTLGGLFSAAFPFPAGEESFCLYDPASAITATASAARTSSPLAVPAASGGGAVSVSNFPATQTVAFAAGTGTISAVNCSSAANLFASNSSAKSRWIYNPIGNGTLYVRLGSGSHTGAATSSFPVEGGQFICIFPLDYKGVVQGLLAAGSQTIQATEVA